MKSIPINFYSRKNIYQKYISKVREKIDPSLCCLIEIKNNKIFINEKRMTAEEAYDETIHSCRYPWVVGNMLNIIASKMKLPDVLFLYCFWDVNINPEDLKEVPLFIGIEQKKLKNIISFQEGVPFLENGYGLYEKYNEICSINKYYLSWEKK